MKHLSLLLTLSFFVLSSDAICQNSKTKKLLSEIEGEWSLDENNELSYTVVLENLNNSKNENYLKAKSFISDINDANLNIIDDNKDDGVLIVKGDYQKIFKGFINMESSEFGVTFTIKINLKDNRARMIVRLDKYNWLIPKDSFTGKEQNYISNVVDEFPINQKVRMGYMKNGYGQTFYHSHKFTKNLIQKFTNSLNSSNSDSDW